MVARIAVCPVGVETASVYVVSVLVLLGQVWEKFARPYALFFYLYHRSLDQFSDKSILEPLYIENPA